jgi:uncharacterized protein YbbK (DUF523 family)
LTDLDYLHHLRVPTKEDPLRILMSACLAGVTCGYDGTANGEYPSALRLLTYDTVKVTRFCPEDFAFGSPREMCDIHGGTGNDVLDGKAKVLTESGRDWTEGLIKAAQKMLQTAQQSGTELAVMMDISAACGSQVIYSGNRFAENKVYQVGAGVCAALLMRNEIKVISQRDYAALEIVYAKVDPTHQPDISKIDHHQTEWYRSYFGV